VRIEELGQGPVAVLFIAIFARASKRRHIPRCNVDFANTIVRDIPYKTLRPVGRQGDAVRLEEAGSSADSVSKDATPRSRKCAHSHGRQVDGSNSVPISINHQVRLRVRREGTTVCPYKRGQRPHAVYSDTSTAPRNSGHSV